MALTPRPAVSIEHLRKMMQEYTDRHMPCWRRDISVPPDDWMAPRRAWYWQWWKYLEAERNRLMEIERVKKIQPIQK